MYIESSCDPVLPVSLQSFIPGVSLSEERGRELHFLLPLSQSRPLVMVELFTKLDKSREELKVQSYGLTACSMEEVCVCKNKQLQSAVDQIELL